jgi:hypothetical protein
LAKVATLEFGRHPHHQLPRHGRDGHCYSLEIRAPLDGADHKLLRRAAQEGLLAAAPKLMLPSVITDRLKAGI